MSCCPKCGYENIIGSETWGDIGFIPLECESCNILYFAKLKETEISSFVIEEEGYKVFKNEVPDLPIGTSVILRHSDHPMHGSIGKIIEKDHRHYRVEFDIGNKIILWCPDSWIFKTK